MMDGWIYRWMDGRWVVGYVGGWMDDGWMDDGWMDGWIDAYVGAWIGEWMSEPPERGTPILWKDVSRQ